MKFSESKKIIAVIGSTGLQGGGLVRAILNDPESPFQVRALTRNPNKAAAKALADAGAEVVAFDMDSSEPQELAEALRDVYGLFVVTNYWEHFDQHRESKQAQAVIAAGEIAGVKHYVWSTLEDTAPFFDSLPEDQRPPKITGNYVPFFDVKEQTNRLFPKDKSTMLFTSAYLEDWYNYGWIQNGTFTANLDEDTQLPVIAVEDIGKSAYGIFKAGEQYLGKTVHLAGDRITPPALMEIATKVLGQKFQFQSVSHDFYYNQDHPVAKLIGNMFEYMRMNPKYSAALDPAEAKELTGNTLVSVEAFFKSHKKEILALGPQSVEA